MERTFAVVDGPSGRTHSWPMKAPGMDRDDARRVVEQAQAAWGARLKAWREHKGLSRRELGFFADMSDDSIRNYEEGRLVKGERDHVDPLFFSGVLRLALALGITVEVLTSQDPHVATEPGPKKKTRRRAA